MSSVSNTFDFEVENRNSVEAPKNFLSFQIGYDQVMLTPAAAEGLWTDVVSKRAVDDGATISLPIRGRTIVMTKDQFDALYTKLDTMYGS